jgi:hypothetical protein
MVYSKRWYQFFDVAEGFGIVTLGLTLLVVLVAVAALSRFPPRWSIEEHAMRSRF